MILRCACVLSIVLGSSPVAFGWWEGGHSHITRNAVQHLPPRLQAFIGRYFTTVDFYAYTEPAGQHYIDIDNYPEFHNGTMPRDLNVLYATHGTAFVNGNGIAPWTIANYRATLTTRMMNAQTLNDYALIARSAGEMAHYIEDINQPLHTTNNHNGQLTGNTGIHGRYEGNMFERHYDEFPIVAAPQNVVYVADTVDWVLDSIETRTYAYVDDIMAADTLGRTFGSVASPEYYDSLWNSTGAFTQSQFQLASEMVASAWYSAWIDAGEPALGVSGDYNADDAVNAADYVAWRKFNGTELGYEVWRATFGEGTGAANAAATPEPGGLLLMLVAGPVFLTFRRSRE